MLNRQCRVGSQLGLHTYITEATTDFLAFPQGEEVVFIAQATTVDKTVTLVCRLVVCETRQLLVTLTWIFILQASFRYRGVCKVSFS